MFTTSSNVLVAGESLAFDWFEAESDWLSAALASRAAIGAAAAAPAWANNCRREGLLASMCDGRERKGVRGRATGVVISASATSGG